MAAPLKLALLPLVGIAATAALGWAAWYPGQLKDDTLLSLTPSCSVLARHRLTGGLIPQVDDIGCYLTPFLRDVASSRPGRGVGSLQLSILVPVLMRQCYAAASPNTRSVWLGPAAVAAIHLLARFVGLGVSLATLGITFLALGSWSQLKSGGPEAVPVAPTPAGAVYWSNLLVVLASFSAGLLGVMSTSSSTWAIASRIYILYPVVLVIPLLALAKGASSKTTRDSREARKQLLEYSAESVSYSFERTWSYLRKIALVSASLYWFGISRLIRGLYLEPGQLSGPAAYLLLNYVLGAVYCVLAILVERITIRPVNSLQHPLTGKPRPQLVADCLRAISLAPAGSPYLERGIWAPILTGIIAGPGAALALWWSGAEEENGWYSRRAWREAAATAKTQ
ncbi:unnamed protein product [Parajaminaea phylloscopi]